MKLFQTSKFCCCSDLRTGEKIFKNSGIVVELIHLFCFIGGLIIGYLSLISEILNMTALGNHWATSSTFSITSHILVVFGLGLNT